MNSSVARPVHHDPDFASAWERVFGLRLRQLSPVQRVSLTIEPPLGDGVPFDLRAAIRAGQRRRRAATPVTAAVLARRCAS